MPTSPKLEEELFVQVDLMELPDDALDDVIGGVITHGFYHA